MAVDTTHAQMNIPATFLWADGLDKNPTRVTFTEPPGAHWKVGTQLYPTADPLTFTAPNLQYFMDSPTEFSDFVTSTFSVPNSYGKPVNFRIVAHSDGPQANITSLPNLLQPILLHHIHAFYDSP